MTHRIRIQRKKQSSLFQNIFSSLDSAGLNELLLMRKVNALNLMKTYFTSKDMNSRIIIIIYNESTEQVRKVFLAVSR